MTRGRRPVPTHLRLLRGNPRQHAINREEPEAPDGPVLMPPWLRVLDGIAAGYNTMSLDVLRAIAQDEGIKGRARMNKAQLIEAITRVRPGPREMGWQELAPMLGSMRLVTAADVHALALTVDAYVDYIELRRIIEDSGQTYRTEGRYGLQVKSRPEVVMAGKRWEQTIKGLIEFGMTPASRSRVSAEPKPNDDPLDGMRGRREDAG
jgi:P27 family predicted phage terminase small subunit